MSDKLDIEKLTSFMLAYPKVPVIFVVKVPDAKAGIEGMNYVLCDKYPISYKYYNVYIRYVEYDYYYEHTGKDCKLQQFIGENAIRKHFKEICSEKYPDIGDAINIGIDLIWDTYIKEGRIYKAIIVYLCFNN
jgi:hypothetical protein